MKFLGLLGVSVLTLLLFAFGAEGGLRAQVLSANQPAISLGGIFGNPSGATLRYPIGITRALDLDFGPDYFGSPRLQMDYVWQFHAFRSSTVGEYFGPGLAVAFAKGINTFYTHEWGHESFAATEDNGFGIGGRAILGMRVTPAASRLEFFVESGPMVPMTLRYFDLDFDGAFGVRYRL